MSREHTEFIQAQSLPWRDDPAYPGTQCKLLSVDDETGALTQLQRYPAEFIREHPLSLACGEEFYVLSGSFYLNNFEYSAGCYAYFPAGFERGKLYIPNGAVVLRFTDHKAVLATEDPEGTQQRAEGRTPIHCIDTYRMSWDYSVHDIRMAHLGCARKNLRIDPVTKQRTFLFMTSPQSHPTNWRGPQESHPTPEESYQLYGDLTGHLGTMHPGAYFWRPPHIPHGPFGSKGGSLSLIRFVDGPHENIWSKESAPFYYEQPYTPVLPKGVVDVGPFQPTSNY